MLKNIALFLTMLIPTLALAEVEPLSTPSPNVGTITPTAITAVTGSFSGSVTASSVTVLGDGLAVKGGQGFAAPASGYGKIYGLSGQGLTLQGEVGSTNGISMLESAGNFYYLVAGASHLFLQPTYGKNVGIGYAAGATVPQKLSVVGRTQTDDLTVTYGANVSSLTVSGSTFTVATTGIVSAPSQPAVRATDGTGISIPNGSITQVYFGVDDYDRQNIHDVTNSSGSFTVPTGGGGLYYLDAYGNYAVGAAGGRQVYIFVDGVEKLSGNLPTSSAAFSSQVKATGVLSLTAGQVVTVKTYQDSGGNLTFSPIAFTMVKIW